jgi:predicted NUDIX family NTP pyrophosphohydrolase
LEFDEIAVVTKRTAGLLMFRKVPAGVEILLVHPGGPLSEKKDNGAWSIPKGICESDEGQLAAALREFNEETGFDPHPPYIELGTVRQPSGTAMSAWAFEGSANPAELISNSFHMEWPPHSGKMATFPEVDRAAWFSIREAKIKILEGQCEFIDALERRLITNRDL